jgi:hypothetical protein
MAYGLGDDTQTQSVLSKFEQAIDLNARAKQGLSENKANLVALATKAKAITDPTQRAAIQAKIKEQTALYVGVLNFYNDASQKLQSFNDFVKGLLQDAGIQVPTLGFLPAIPAVWVAVLVAAGVALTAVITANNMHSGAIAETSKVVDQMLAGKITADQAAKTIEALNKQAADQTDLLGIKSALGEVGKLAVPVLLILAAVFVLPQIMEVTRAFRPRSA